MDQDKDGKYSDYNQAYVEKLIDCSRKMNDLFRSSDASIKRSRSSLGEFDDDKRRTYLVKYAEGDAAATDGQNDDQANFSTAV